jgi:hypothetical protein
MQDDEAKSNGVSPFGEAKIAEFFEQDKSAQRISYYEVLSFEPTTDSESVDSDRATDENCRLQRYLVLTDIHLIGTGALNR